MNAPFIDGRSQADVLADLAGDLPGYTPELSASAGMASFTLMQILARYATVLIGGLNQVPQRGLLAFLDMLGTHLLPAQAAEAPLVFTLAQNSPVDVTLPANSQVAAQPAPPVPSQSTTSSPATASASSSQPLLFATLESITLSKAQLTTLYSVDPGSDEYADHSASLTSGFTLFDNMVLTEHAIYLGHDTLFAFNGNIYLLLLIGLRTGAGSPLTIQWDYLGQSGWVPLSSAAENDTTGGLQTDGTIILQRQFGPPAKQGTFAGKTSYWVRGSLATPLLPNGTGGQNTLPVINTIQARLQLTNSNVTPDAAFADAVSLDISKDFYPFGQQPSRFSTFYLASTEVFQRQGANVQIALQLSQDGVTQGSLALKWEYFNGSIWSDLGISSYLFTDDDVVSFLCPRDWQQSIVNGVKNYWMRVRILAGGYGCPLRSNTARLATINDISGSTLIVDSIAGFNPGQQVTLTDSNGQNSSSQTIYQLLNPNLLTLPAGVDASIYEGGTISSNGLSMPINDVWGSTLKVSSTAGYCGGEPALLLDSSQKNSASVTVQRILGMNQLILTTVPTTGVDYSTIGPPNLPSIAASSLQPPVVSSVAMSYAYYTDPTLLDACLTKNDFVFIDNTEAIIWPDQTFTPFQPVSDAQAAVHFGFNSALPAGLVSLYADIPQTVTQGSTSAASPFTWEYLSASGWNELGVLDESAGFQTSGMIQFAGQPDAVASEGLGGELYWVRARLKQGEEVSPAPVSGIWLNAVWASQQTSNATELEGTSDGNPGQTFTLQHTPVLAGEVIEVQEWTGLGDGWQTALADVPQTDLRFDFDSTTGLVKAVWVHWYEQPNLYNSGPNDRHYTIERATGFITFGPPGMIPPAGSLVSATYTSGGGVAGNVSAGAISQLHTAIPYVNAVTNPIAASGGTDTETTTAVVARGPQSIRNRNRAISATDYEWLARQASPDVGKVRCSSITGPDGHGQRGWVTLVVVPWSLDVQPEPTPEFQVRVLNYVSALAPFTAASQIRIVGPQYSPIDVWMEVVPTDASQAAQLETQLRSGLNQFLHPLTGGPSGQGWDFGQPMYVSQIAALVQGTTGVDYVPQILLKVNGQVFGDFVPVEAGSLVCAGTHEIKLMVE